MNYRKIGYENEKRMRLTTLNLPPLYIEALDQLAKEGKYPNRAETIRMAIRDLLTSEVWQDKPETDMEEL